MRPGISDDRRGDASPSPKSHAREEERVGFIVSLFKARAPRRLRLSGGSRGQMSVTWAAGRYGWRVFLFFLINSKYNLCIFKN